MSAGKISNFEGTITVTAPTGGATTGTYYTVGAVSGIAMNSPAAGEDLVLRIAGSGYVEIGADKLGATASQAWTRGDRLYYDATNKRWTKSSTGNGNRVGIAWSAALTAATSGDVLVLASVT